MWDEHDGAALASASSVGDLPDAWSPSYSSQTRESGTQVATFNLLNTVVGGGALSLPFAFSKCGWLVGIIVVACSVEISKFSLNLLCTLARKLSCDSYSEVVRKSMGSRSAEILDLTQFFMLFLVVVAFLVLIRDISSDIIEYVMASSVGLDGASEGAGFVVRMSGAQRNMALCGIVVVMFPLMAQRSLHALRHVSYVGTASVLLLLIVLGEKTFRVNTKGSGGLGFFESIARGGPRGAATAGPAVDPLDILTALPIILIAFLCQFNVVSVYASLRAPTPARMSKVLNWTTWVSGALYAAFGLLGYFFATDRTADNILNNFSPRDPALIAARTGLLLTLMCQTPMVLLPCRQSLLLLLNKAGASCGLDAMGSASSNGGRVRRAASLGYNAVATSAITGIAPSTVIAEGTGRNHSSVRAGGGFASRLGQVEEDTIVPGKPVLDSSQSSELKDKEKEKGKEEEERGQTGDSPVARICATLLLIAVCVGCAIAAPGVATIWSIAGSSVSLVLAFLFPSLAYLSLWFQLGKDARVVDGECMGAWVLLVLSVSMIVLCTAQSLGL